MIIIGLLLLAAVGVLAIAVRPSWMRSFGWLVLGFSGLGFVGTLFAAQSGEELLDHFRASGQTISGTLEDHAEMADTAQAVAGIFFAFVLVWVLFAWWRRRKGEEAVTAKVKNPKVINIILTVLVVAAGIGATASVTLTGHSGAKSVWETEK